MHWTDVEKGRTLRRAAQLNNVLCYKSIALNHYLSWKGLQLFPIPQPLSPIP
jgi:hypothetical protein